MKKTKEVYFKLTFKGLLSLYLDEETLNRVMDAVELQLYRGKNNAVVFEEGTGGEFVRIVKEGV